MVATYPGHFTTNWDLPLKDYIDESAAVVLNIQTKYGATGDGTTDDTAALIAAFNDIPTHTSTALGVGVRLHFPDGTYRTTLTLGSFTFSDAIIDLGNAVINSELANGNFLTLTGSYGSQVSLTADGAKGTKVLTVPTTGFAVGDRIMLGSNQIFDSTRTSAKIGELNAILSIDSGTQMTVKTELQADYTTAQAATIVKVTPIQNVTVRGGHFRNTVTGNTTSGLDVHFGVGIRLQETKFYNFGIIQSHFINVCESVVTGCEFRLSVSTGTSYGISLADASCDIVVANNVFREVRHSISINNGLSTAGGGTGYGITRRILGIGNDIIDSEPPTTGSGGGDALDTHSGCEEIYYIGNVIHSASGQGINFEARSGVIGFNIITDAAHGGIGVHPYADFPSRVKIIGNTVVRHGDGSAIKYTVGPAAARLTVQDNTVDESTLTNPISINGASGQIIKRLALTGNSVETTGDQGIFVSWAGSATVSGNAVLAGLFGIRMQNCDSAAISANAVEVNGSSSTNRRGIYLTGSAYASITGNTVRNTGTGTSTQPAVGFDTLVTNSLITGNVANGYTTTVDISTGTGNAQANNLP